MFTWVLAALIAGAVLVVVVVGGLVVLVRRRAARGSGADTGPIPFPADSPFAPGPDGPRRDLRAVPPAPGLATGPRATVRGVLPSDLAAAPGGLTLVQLSSQFCADCRATRSVLLDVAAEHPGVAVREVDVALRPELVRLLGIRRTPTTLVVDAAGVELARTIGVPRRADLVGIVAPLRPTG